MGNNRDIVGFIRFSNFLLEHLSPTGYGWEFIAFSSEGYLLRNYNISKYLLTFFTEGKIPIHGEICA